MASIISRGVVESCVVVVVVVGGMVVVGVVVVELGISVVDEDDEGGVVVVVVEDDDPLESESCEFKNPILGNIPACSSSSSSPSSSTTTSSISTLSGSTLPFLGSAVEKVKHRRKSKRMVNFLGTIF